MNDDDTDAPWHHSLSTAVVRLAEMAALVAVVYLIASCSNGRLL